MTDGFIRRCKLKGVRQFDAILCRTDVTGEGEHDPRWSSFDISANAVVDFVSGPEGEDEEIVFKLAFFLHPISVLQRLIMAFEQGRIPQRFRIAFTGPYAQVRPAVREWYAACFMEEKDDADLYHIPSVDFVLYVVDGGFVIARHVDPVTYSWSFVPCFEVDHLRPK